MHRPRIASVAGDVIHLDGTTIEEVKEYHRDTLMLACEEANQQYGVLLKRYWRAQEEKREGIERHKRLVGDIANGIKFDG